MSPHWGPGWIGYGHAISGEGEYDQAISAYSTASKYMKESHLPPMFIAMQYLQIHNLALAEKFLILACASSSFDPHLENEMGVVHFKNGKYEEAIVRFEKVIKLVGEKDIQNKCWVPTLNNLGHAYLRIK